MVIVDLPTAHGPHLWYYSVLFGYSGNFIQFLKIKECLRPQQDNILFGRNEYLFESEHKFVGKCP